ncbi:hypothetical protein L228DRAFT_261832 [Xylona heveae TC161]|uniref:DUF788-domain-containing protein n=1 Tax=Xylona heveae (strain CBS 132557 / TC161) TaxID=1328760 RepID=A0A165G3A0_XYLHT|nr:hypothetical protein L228DRAFT_261832 [Xylona heveae TC161]KZF21689.1 hypothetical protein L228DRAFT_261832 [Xylona heveae TC161]
MAQKAAKQLAARNAQLLKRTHLIALSLHGFFLLLRLVLFRSQSTRSTLTPYLLLSAPALLVEFWFERIGRPKYVTRPGSSTAELKNSGEDLEAKGLTEYLWDVLYWTWGCIAVAAVFGNRAWWLWIVIPLYSVWLAYTTFGGMKQGLGGLGGADTGAQATSNRQKKMEKRGGQRVQYR